MSVICPEMLSRQFHTWIERTSNLGVKIICMQSFDSFKFQTSSSEWFVQNFSSSSSLSLSLFFFCLNFRATPGAYGGTQARGGIRAVAAALHRRHGNTRSELQSCIWELHRRSWQRQIFNPLSKARDQTCVLVDTSWVRFHWAAMGTPRITFLLLIVNWTLHLDL